MALGSRSNNRTSCRRRRMFAVLSIGVLATIASASNIRGAIRTSSKTGTLHQCKFTGPPDHLEEYLTQKQLTSKTELYFGKQRSKGYFQHLFVESECTNGLPKPESACFSTMRIGQQCGPDEDWSVIAPDEFDGPGVMWRNDKECDEDVHNTNVTVAADFFALRLTNAYTFTAARSMGNRHRPLTSKTPTMTSRPSRQVTLSTPSTRRVFQRTSTEGLQRAPWRTLCNVFAMERELWGDHDWEAFTPGESADGKAKVRWYTSHSCDRARVGVDYYCSLGPTGQENKRRLHRCTFKGKSTVDTKPKSWCENKAEWMSSESKPHVGTHPWYGTERHAGTPAPGFCMLHKFEESECTNGLPLRASDVLQQHTAKRSVGQNKTFIL